MVKRGGEPELVGAYPFRRRSLAKPVGVSWMQVQVIALIGTSAGPSADESWRPRRGCERNAVRALLMAALVAGSTAVDPLQAVLDGSDGDV